LNNVIRYCVSINDANTTEGSGSFFIWNGSDVSKQLANCYIYNNVAVNSSAPVISFETASEHENFFFCNNIFVGTGHLVSGKNCGSQFTANVWWSPGDSQLYGPLVTDITDPYKLNELKGFILKPGSSLRNHGSEIKPAFGFDPATKDFFGNPVPQGSVREPGIFEMD